MVSQPHVCHGEPAVKEVMDAMQFFDFPWWIQTQETDGWSRKAQPFGRGPLRSRKDSVIELEPVKCPMDAPDFRGLKW